VLAVNRAKRDVRVVYHSFRPLLPLLKEAAPEELTPERCFQIQLLLIHFYRRVVLKDPLLPEELLPAHWAGQSARQLCINIYQRVAPGRWRLSARRAKPPSANCPCPARSTINALVVLQAHKE
jgi:phenylacetic acid degradation operon negative regulatory protein